MIYYNDYREDNLDKLAERNTIVPRSLLNQLPRLTFPPPHIPPPPDCDRSSPGTVCGASVTRGCVAEEVAVGAENSGSWSFFRALCTLLGGTL